MKINIHRKKRGTHKTRHARKCNRNKNRSTRSQRGGVTMSEVFDNVIGEFSSCTNADFRLTINFRFGSCENFNKLLEFRNEMSPDLKTVVCNKFTDEQIRINEYLLATQPRVKALKMQKLETNWPDFVVHLKKVVEAQFEKHKAASAADIQQRLWNLKFPTSAKAQAAQEAKAQAAAAAAAAAQRPSAARPSSVAARPSMAPSAAEPDTRPVAPPGWTLQGNVWTNGKGYFPEEYFKPREQLTGQALRDALNALMDD